MPSRLLAFAGSARSGSYNHKLIEAASAVARDAGAAVTVLSMQDYPLPLFDEDFEAKETPDNATRLRDLFLEHDGLLIASPEYNSSLSPMLKNTIDWVSRPADNQPMLAAFRGKVAGIMAASPGALGGLRGLVHLRSILSSIGVLVIPDQVAIGSAFQAFDDSGKLTDEGNTKRLNGMIESLCQTVKRLKSGV